MAFDAVADSRNDYSGFDCFQCLVLRAQYARTRVAGRCRVSLGVLAPWRKGRRAVCASHDAQKSVQRYLGKHLGLDQSAILFLLPRIAAGEFQL